MKNNNNDALVGYLNNTPIYRDSDFGNAYALYSEWVKMNNLLEEDPEELYEDFECWCEKYEVTPHRM